jgi:hypothetical protein
LVVEPDSLLPGVPLFVGLDAELCVEISATVLNSVLTASFVMFDVFVPGVDMDDVLDDVLSVPTLLTVIFSLLPGVILIVVLEPVVPEVTSVIVLDVVLPSVKEDTVLEATLPEVCLSTVTGNVLDFEPMLFVVPDVLLPDETSVRELDVELSVEISAPALDLVVKGAVFFVMLDVVSGVVIDIELDDALWVLKFFVVIFALISRFILDVLLEFRLSEETQVEVLLRWVGVLYALILEFSLSEIESVTIFDAVLP